MNSTDKICKEVLDIFTFSKDQALKSIVTEYSNGSFSMSQEDLQVLTNIVNISLDTSFQRAFSSFQKKVGDLTTQESSLKKTTTKK